jgi:hypothetical protein
MTEAVRFSETLCCCYKTAWCGIPEGCRLNLSPREPLKSIELLSLKPLREFTIFTLFALLYSLNTGFTDDFYIQAVFLFLKIVFHSVLSNTSVETNDRK